MTTRLALAIVAFLPASIAAPSSAAEPKIFTSGPCVTAGVCAEFGTYGDFGPLKTINFKAPGAGKVAVTATGDMQCLNTRNYGSDIGVVDLSGRVYATGEPAAAAGEGVTRFAMRFGLPPASSPALSSALNLAGTRVFQVQKGPVSFEYRLVKNRMDEGTYCYVSNLSLTAIYIP